ncbi:hypothetical protein E2C01_094739 [Portunus trituberculatus]|uniref:Uncharacterized protein n=1 Tax=Portunus trituberculatus TaxID=210409 RepID=A0A5B7JT59_PORTR|nr:hypothetical protein [Portunus trituberculatus]
MAGGRGKGGLAPRLLRLLRCVSRLVVAALRPVRRPRHVQREVYHVWAAVRPHAWARVYLLLGHSSSPPWQRCTSQVSPSLPPSPSSLPDRSSPAAGQVSGRNISFITDVSSDNMRRGSPFPIKRNGN